MQNLERLTYTLDEARVLLGIGRNVAYDAAKRGDIAGVRIIRIGRRLLLPREALDRVLRGEAA